MRFEVARIDPVTIAGADALLAQDLMSPYVWQPAEGPLALLVRVVPRAGDAVTGRIWLGRGGVDGLHFEMEPAPLIVPGPGPLDILGCEDPTVVPTERGCIVYYTGLDATGAGQMLYAEGDDIHSLKKIGIALASSKTELNTKEATVERTADGQWRLFYEFARDNRSRIGLAWGPGPAGPWDEQPEPILARPDHWDNWHLSTGPLLMTDPEMPVMFYNGSDPAARWGIGWAAFAADCRSLIARCDGPLIAPPEHATNGRDISFSASVVESDGAIWLYYSSDDRALFRATIVRS